MTILLEGLNRIRDLVNTDIDRGQLGTGTAASTEDNTGLQTPIATTLLTLTKTVASKQINFSYTLPSTSVTTATYTEFELRQNTTPVNYDRVVFTGVSFTTNGTEELSVIKRYFIRRV